MKVDGSVFDLSAVSASDFRKGYRLFRTIGQVGSITLSIVWVIAIVVLAIRPGLSYLPIPVTIGLVFGAAIIGVLALASLMNAPGATSLEVRPDGVRLIYANGRTKQFRWADSRTAITLYEFPEVLPNGRRFPLSRFWFSTRFPQSNPLTAEAFEAVLLSAQIARLRITRSSNAFGTSRAVIRIMGSGSSLVRRSR